MKNTFFVFFNWLQSAVGTQLCVGVVSTCCLITGLTDDRCGVCQQKGTKKNERGRRTPADGWSLRGVQVQLIPSRNSARSNEDNRCCQRRSECSQHFCFDSSLIDLSIVGFIYSWKRRGLEAATYTDLEGARHTWKISSHFSCFTANNFDLLILYLPDFKQLLVVFSSNIFLTWFGKSSQLFCYKQKIQTKDIIYAYKELCMIIFM